MSDQLTDEQFARRQRGELLDITFKPERTSDDELASTSASFVDEHGIPRTPSGERAMSFVDDRPLGSRRVNRPISQEHAEELGWRRPLLFDAEE